MPSCLYTMPTIPYLFHFKHHILFIHVNIFLFDSSYFTSFKNMLICRYFHYSIQIIINGLQMNLFLQINTYKLFNFIKLLHLLVLFAFVVLFLLFGLFMFWGQSKFVVYGHKHTRSFVHEILFGP